MSVEDFDYKAYALTIRNNVKADICGKFNIQQEEYILDLAEKFVKMAGEALCDDKRFVLSVEQAEFICKSIVDSCVKCFIENKDTNKTLDNWDSVMQRIAFTVFEVSKKGIIRNISHDLILQAVEHHTQKAYLDAVVALNNINTDVGATKKNDRYDEYAKKLEDIYNGETKSPEIGNASFIFSLTDMLRYLNINIIQKYIKKYQCVVLWFQYITDKLINRL